MGRNREAHDKPRRICRNAQIEIHQTVAEQSGDAHQRSDGNPAPVGAQAFMNVKIAIEIKAPARKRAERPPASPVSDKTLGNVIVRVRPVEVGDVRHVRREGGFKGADANAEQRMALGHAESVLCHPEAITHFDLNGLVGLKDGKSAVGAMAAVGHPGKNSRGKQQQRQNQGQSQAPLRAALIAHGNDGKDQNFDQGDRALRRASR